MTAVQIESDWDVMAETEDGQKTCPSCYKLNNAQNSVCDVCGTDLTDVPARPVQGRRSIFGYVPTGAPTFVAPVISEPKVIKTAQPKTDAAISHPDSFEFTGYRTPIKPW